MRRITAWTAGIGAVALALTAAPSDAGKPGGGGGGGGGTTPLDIAFLDTGGSWTMKQVAANGSGVTSLLADALTADPAWSPDGTTIAFTAYRNGTGNGLYTLKVADGTLTKVCAVTSVVGKPAWSPVPTPDGSYRILFGDADPNHPNLRHDLFAVRPDGTGLVNLTNTSDRPEGTPTWAWDGKRFAAFSAGKVRVYTLADTGLAIASSVELNFSNVTVASLSLDWARTTDRIVCKGTDNDLWVLDVSNPAAPTAREIVATAGGTEESPSWSPDDSRIVFRRSGFSGRGTNGLFTVAYNKVTGEATDLRALVTSDRDLLAAPDWVRVVR